MTLNILLDKEYYELKRKITLQKVKDVQIYTAYIGKTAYQMQSEYGLRPDKAWKEADKYVKSCLDKYHKRLDA